MSDSLRQLIDTLREQACVLETALSLTEEQTHAIVRRDVDRLQDLTHELDLGVARGQVIEERRAGFSAELAAALGRGGADATITALCGLLPPREASELRSAGELVVNTVERLARRSSANQQLLSHELEVIDQVMRIAHRGERSTYIKTGGYDRDTIALLDARA